MTNPNNYPHASIPDLISEETQEMEDDEDDIIRLVRHRPHLQLMHEHETKKHTIQVPAQPQSAGRDWQPHETAFITTTATTNNNPSSTNTTNNNNSSSTNNTAHNTSVNSSIVIIKTNPTVNKTASGHTNNPSSSINTGNHNNNTGSVNRVDPSYISNPSNSTSRYSNTNIITNSIGSGGNKSPRNNPFRDLRKRRMLLSAVVLPRKSWLVHRRPSDPLLMSFKDYHQPTIHKSQSNAVIRTLNATLVC
ncbi:hypothetical protein BCR41DRAFT_116794 [Lobosporangium transversale]|uniref:Uncharacterized protein n=1 Tax=Lobosporangium transversale TaxID=64571 RepID=A0A1Y2GZ58_9FUNG|nr:hypothetical protein BCR41DRAFT_116794 [Lobosporangium transversale]ORZ27598.1 hypothetical protein BCR41DRAFT_116794 [Lobosporangium transversale]|eukprot:XP_021885301.1 hypothetical protein BCR41DRAFT_116794 [Lobosporangium transversale]